jgi:hypothetical protein
MPDINLAPTNYDLEAIQKRRKMAELLMQQAQQPLEMPQTPGVRISPVSGLAKLLQSYTAGKKLEKADTEEKQYQSDYLSDLGFLLRNAGKTTPATEAIPEKIENITTPNLANQNLQEVANRQRLMRDSNAVINPFEKQIFQGMDSGQASEKLLEISKLPGETVEQRVTPAVPAMAGSPLLSPDLLSGNNANNYLKTSQGKMLLAQLLMQQQTQQQAAAQRQQEAALAVHSVAPGAALVQNNKAVYTNPKETLPKWEKSSIYENGQEVTGWVNTNAPDIPGSFVKGATKPEMTKAQQLDAEIKLYGTKVEADKAADVGRPVRKFEPLPRGVPVGANKIGKDKETGKDVYKLNNDLFVGD